MPSNPSSSSSPSSTSRACCLLIVQQAVASETTEAAAVKQEQEQEQKQQQQQQQHPEDYTPPPNPQPLAEPTQQATAITTRPTNSLLVAINASTAESASVDSIFARKTGRVAAAQAQAHQAHGKLGFKGKLANCHHYQDMCGLSRPGADSGWDAQQTCEAFYSMPARLHISAGGKNVGQKMIRKVDCDEHGAVTVRIVAKESLGRA